MSGNFEGIKQQKFGVEVECTGLTREAAAKAISKVLGGSIEHYGGSYDKYNVRDSKDRRWSVVYDSSIRCVDKNGNSASRNYAVELVTPVLEYEDMSLLQEVVRAVRKAGGVTGAEYRAGIHVHIDGAPYDARTLRNLVNIFASKENFLFDMLQVSPMRETYCQKVDRNFLERLNKQKPKTIEEIQMLWYRGDMNEVHHHYSSTRYRACNLHSFFASTQCSGSGGMGGKTGLYFIDCNPDPQMTDIARCVTARQNSGVSNHRGEHSAVFCDLNENPQITDAARCLHTRMDQGVSTGTHRGERSGVLVEDTPRAILNPFKENTWQNGRRIKEPNEPMFTLTVTDRHGIVHHGMIRRLMPIEAWRLQGFSDEQFNKVAATGMSDAQLYKQAGNAVSVPVVEDIARHLLEFDKEINAYGKCD